MTNLSGPKQAAPEPGSGDTKKTPESSDPCFSLLLGQLTGVTSSQVSSADPFNAALSGQGGAVSSGQEAIPSEKESGLLPGVAEQQDQPEKKAAAHVPVPAVTGEEQELSAEFNKSENKDPGKTQAAFDSDENQQTMNPDKKQAEGAEGSDLQVSRESAQIQLDNHANEQPNTFSSAMQQASHQAAQRGGETVAASRAEGQQVAPAHVPDPADLFDNTVSIVKDGTRLAVKLEPEGMGKLDINLSLDKGSLNAQILVADDAAKTLIENNMNQLLDALLKEGITVGGFSVALKDGGRQYKLQDEAGNRQTGSAASDAAIDAARQATASNGLVSIFI